MIRMAHCASMVCTHSVVYAKYLPSLWESGMLTCARQRVLTWPSPSKNLGCWMSNEGPWETAFHLGCHNLFLEKLNMSCETPLGEDSWKLRLISSRLHPMYFFLLLICCIIHYDNLSHQYSYLLSLVSPSGQFLNLGVVLELTTQGPSMIFFLVFFLWNIFEGKMAQAGILSLQLVSDNCELVSSSS